MDQDEESASRVSRGETVPDALCPRVEAAFEILARKWTGLIIRALLPRELCFSALERSIPALSARVLTMRMKELVDAGIAYRRVGAEGPVRVVYGLTEKGMALEPVMRGIAEWASDWGEDGSGAIESPRPRA